MLCIPFFNSSFFKIVFEHKNKNQECSKASKMITYYLVGFFLFFFVFVFVFWLGFLSLIFTFSQDCSGRGRPFRTPLFHLRPLYKHLGVSLEITDESSALYIANNWTRAGSFWCLCASC